MDIMIAAQGFSCNNSFMRFCLRLRHQHNPYNRVQQEQQTLQEVVLLTDHIKQLEQAEQQQCPDELMASAYAAL